MGEEGGFIWLSLKANKDNAWLVLVNRPSKKKEEKISMF